jgi:hypothetical protein
MTEEIKTVIYTEDEIRVGVDEFDEGQVWLSLQRSGASMYVVLSLADAEQIIAGMQKILAREVTA